MAGFEMRTSSLGNDRSTNWATTTSLDLNIFVKLVEESPENSTKSDINQTKSVMSITDFDTLRYACILRYARIF